MENIIFRYEHPFSISGMDKEFEMTTEYSKDILKFLEEKGIKPDFLRIESSLYSELNKEIRNSNSKTILYVYKHVNGKLEAHLKSETIII